MRQRSRKGSEMLGRGLVQEEACWEGGRSRGPPRWPALPRSRSSGVRRRGDRREDRRRRPPGPALGASPSHSRIYRSAVPVRAADFVESTRPISKRAVRPRPVPDVNRSELQRSERGRVQALDERGRGTDLRAIRRAHAKTYPRKNQDRLGTRLPLPSPGGLRVNSRTVTSVDAGGPDERGRARPARDDRRRPEFIVGRASRRRQRATCNARKGEARSAPGSRLSSAVNSASAVKATARFPQVLADDEGGLRRETYRTAAHEAACQQSVLTNACAAYPVVEVLRFLGQAYDT